MITQIYRTNIAGQDAISYVRERDPETSHEKLRQAHELIDSSHAAVGDNNAFKVSLLPPEVFKQRDTY